MRIRFWPVSYRSMNDGQSYLVLLYQPVKYQTIMNHKHLLLSRAFTNYKRTGCLNQANSFCVLSPQTLNAKTYAL